MAGAKAAPAYYAALRADGRGVMNGGASSLPMLDMSGLRKAKGSQKRLPSSPG